MLKKVLYLILFAILISACSQSESGENAYGEHKAKKMEILKKMHKLPKPEGFDEIVDKIHGMKFYLPEGWVYTVNDGVASFYDPNYDAGLIIIPLSDASSGVEKILRNFENPSEVFVKGDDKSVIISFKSDLPSVISLSMPGKLGEIIELKSQKEVRVVISAFKGEKAGIAYVFFFEGEKMPKELEILSKSLDLIKERGELYETVIEGFTVVKIPKGYTTEGKKVDSKTCPGYDAGLYAKITGPNGGTYEFIYGEFGYTFYTNLELGDQFLEEFIKQYGECSYYFLDFQTFDQYMGQGSMDMCYQNIESYASNVISTLIEERFSDLRVEEFDLEIKNAPPDFVSKLYVVTSATNPKFVAYVVASGIEREENIYLTYGTVGIKLVAGSVILIIIDAKSPEEFSIFMNVKDTAKFKEDWQKKNFKRLQACNQAYIREIRKEIQHSREIGNMIQSTMREISAMHWDSWEKEQRFQEEMAESMTRILSDYTAVQDPETQEVYEVEDFAQRYWINDEGQVLGTSWDVSESDLIAAGWRPLRENPSGFVRGVWG